MGQYESVLSLTLFFSITDLSPDKEFSGTDRLATRAGPVQFEKEKLEEDPFGLDQFLKQAKRSSKRPKDDRRDDTRDKRKRKD